MKVGKAAAVAVGGGIILLQIANQQGYITIDWNKINKKVDKVTDKVEEAVTGQGPSWADKVSHMAWVFSPPRSPFYVRALLTKSPEPACDPPSFHKRSPFPV